MTAKARRIAWAATVAALAYSAVHFVHSGVIFPLAEPNLGKFEEETPALREYLRTGEPVHFNNPVQYGAVFFGIVHPLILWTHGERQFANWLYALQILFVGLAWAATWATLRRFVAVENRPIVMAWLAVLWLNFAPVYTTIAVKSVENWELLLIATALWAHVRGRLWVMAIALAAGTLIKILPLFFFYYLLVTNRRAFLYAIVALIALLAIAQAIYGPQMGFWYLPQIAKSAAGNSYGLTWHENVSVKAAIAKIVGRLETDPQRSGYIVALTPGQLKAVTIIGDAAVIAVLAALTWLWMRPVVRDARTIIWEWSLATVALLVISPNTTFEYAALALGAVAYGLVRIVGDEPFREPRGRTRLYLVGAMFFLGVLLPRQLLNQLTFVTALNRLTGYTHLNPSEAYQFYCFPLLGLLLLAAAIWRLRPL
jgi:hypothetical protein